MNERSTVARAASPSRRAPLAVVEQRVDRRARARRRRRAGRARCRRRPSRSPPGRARRARRSPAARRPSPRRRRRRTPRRRSASRRASRRGRARSAAACGSWPANSTRSSRPSSRGQALERRALGAVADDQVAQVRVAVAQQPHRAQDVGVALARDEVRDGDERSAARTAAGCGPGGRCRGGRRACRGAPRSRTSCADARASWRARAVPRRRCDGRSAPTRDAAARCRDVAAVHGDDERGAGPARAAPRRPPGRRCARGRGRTGSGGAARAAWPPAARRRTRPSARRPRPRGGEA